MSSSPRTIWLASPFVQSDRTLNNPFAVLFMTTCSAGSIWPVMSEVFASWIVRPSTFLRSSAVSSSRDFAATENW